VEARRAGDRGIGIAGARALTSKPHHHGTDVFTIA